MYVFLFDIDGTLINSGGAGQAALRGAMASEFDVAKAHDVPVHGLTDRAIAGSLFEKHEIDSTEANWHRFLQAYLRLLPTTLADLCGRVLPGVTKLLDELSSRDDVAVGLLTGNVREGARIKLEHFDLNHHFDFGGFGDLHSSRDDVAREALDGARNHVKNQFATERVCVIGDTPNDVRCARTIGARVVAVATGIFSADQLAPEQPDLLLDDLADPNDVLSFLLT